MQFKDPVLRISINFENKQEELYIMEVLLPELQKRYTARLNTVINESYCIINLDTYRELSHVLMNIIILLGSYVAVDYSDYLGFVVWFDIPL